MREGEDEAWHLPGLLDRSVKAHGERIFIQGCRALRYSEFAEKTDRLATWLLRQGVRRGDRIITLLHNHVDVALAVFAASRLGAIFSVLHPSVSRTSLVAILSEVRPRVAFIDGTTAHLKEAHSTTLYVWAGEGEGSVSEPKLEDVVRQTPPQAPSFPGIDVDIASLVYTSGSTGYPRGVVLTHDNLRFSVSKIQARLQYAADDVIGIALPLSFDYGLYQIFLAMAAGASVVIGRPDWVGPQFLQHLYSNRVTVLPGTPAHFSAVVKLLTRKAEPLVHLRIATNTGEHLSATLIKQFQDLLPGVRIFSMYGLTECKRVSILLPEESVDHVESVGRPLDGTEAYVVDEHDRRLPPGSIGELVVRGRHVGLGYWQATEESNRRFRAGADGGRVLYSGDLCHMDEDGFIYYAGRKDSLIKHRGFRISALEIERTACGLATILEAAAVKSEATGELRLFVVVKEAPVSKQSIVEFLRVRLEPYKLPDEVIVAPELPKTKNGKLDRDALARES